MSISATIVLNASVWHMQITRSVPICVRYPVPGKYTLEQSGVHINLVYSDFYFTEAILKLRGSEFDPW